MIAAIEMLVNIQQFTQSTLDFGDRGSKRNAGLYEINLGRERLADIGITFNLGPMSLTWGYLLLDLFSFSLCVTCALCFP